MAFFSRTFRKPKSAAGPEQRHEALQPKTLRQFQPLDRLSEDQLIVLANRAEHRMLGAGQKLFERGSRDGLDYFLLSGSLELTSGDGRKLIVAADSEKARSAIARLQPRMYDAVAAEPCDFLIIEQDVLNQLLKKAPLDAGEVQDAGIQGADEEHDLLMEFYADLKANKVELPSVPDIAWKVRRVADDDLSTAQDIATVITADVAMSAKVVKACNSPIYRGFSDVTNVREAVVRLGTNATRQLVTVFAMREIFRSRHPQLKQRMESLWQHSREVAALSWVLAHHCEGVNPEEALLAGLLHDIGAIPVLVHAEHHVNLFADEQRLDKVVTAMRAEIGAAMLTDWGFPAGFVEVAQYAEDWHYQSREAKPVLADVVIVAQLHSMISNQRNEGLPAFEQVPAYQRLGELELSASRSLQLLNEGRDKVQEVQRLLATG